MEPPPLKNSIVRARPVHRDFCTQTEVPPPKVIYKRHVYKCKVESRVFHPRWLQRYSAQRSQIPGLIGAIGSIFEGYKCGKLSYVNCVSTIAIARRSRKLNWSKLTDAGFTSFLTRIESREEMVISTIAIWWIVGNCIIRESLAASGKRDAIVTRSELQRYILV